MDLSPTVPSVAHPALLKAHSTVVFKKNENKHLSESCFVPRVTVLSAYLCRQIQQTEHAASVTTEHFSF